MARFAFASSLAAVLLMSSCSLFQEPVLGFQYIRGDQARDVIRSTAFAGLANGYILRNSRPVSEVDTYLSKAAAGLLLAERITIKDSWYYKDDDVTNCAQAVAATMTVEPLAIPIQCHLHPISPL